MRALKPVMNTKLVARVGDDKRGRFFGPLVGGFFSGLNLKASSVELSTGADWTCSSLSCIQFRRLSGRDSLRAAAKLVSFDRTQLWPDMKQSTAIRPPPTRSSAVPSDDVSARSVRWLADLCGLPSVNYLPHAASEEVAQQEHATEVAAHVGWWARHPVPDSNFARSIGPLPDIPDAELFAALRQKGYDGLLYRNEREIIAHCFFQRHDSELHAFSMWISEEHRGGGLMPIVCFDFMAYASARPGIVRARFGTGHPWDRLLRRLKQFSADLGWRVREGGWVEFSASDPERTGATASS
jgi:RimJ/RimL family protein N-acetyltransferase